VSLIQSHCSPLVNADDFKRRFAELKDCRAWLGPNQPGITTLDPSADPGRTDAPQDVPGDEEPNEQPAGGGTTPEKSTSGGPGASGAPGPVAIPPEIQREIERTLEELEDRSGQARTPDASHLLDFLLAP
jgi:hypothetical protein